jgi:hypothetical protein
MAWSSVIVSGSFVPWLLTLSLPSVGLSNSTLYDVLDPNDGNGNVSVAATTFNVTCGYLTDSNAQILSTDLEGLNIIIEEHNYTLDLAADAKHGHLSPVCKSHATWDLTHLRLM